MSSPQDLPQYITQPDFESQQPFFILFFALIYEWFNSNGFYLPALTNAQAAAMVAQYGVGPWPIKQWYNSDSNKLQFLDATGAIQTVTSV